jgi:hypothetical protein
MRTWNSWVSEFDLCDSSPNGSVTSSIMCAGGGRQSRDNREDSDANGHPVAYLHLILSFELNWTADKLLSESDSLRRKPSLEVIGGGYKIEQEVGIGVVEE